MKSAFAISGLGHAAIIAYAVVSITSPRPLAVEDVEALPIEIVPLSELTKSIAGDKEAEVSDRPAPTPTTAPPRPEPETAQNIGETNQDVPSDALQDTPAPPVEATQTPPAPEPAEPAPEPPTPATPPEPAETPEPQPVEDPQPEEEAVTLPEQVALPKARPEPPKPDEQQNQVRDQTALLNKAEPTAGGSRRSQEPASRGVTRANSDTELSASEIDALRAQIQQCWNVGALAGASDAQNLRAKVEFRLDRNGNIEGRPTATASGSDATTNRTFAGGARRAVQRCAPYRLPAEKYETWADVTVNFSLADML